MVTLAGSAQSSAGVWAVSLGCKLEAAPIQKPAEQRIWWEMPHREGGGQQQGPRLQADECAHLGESPEERREASSWK